MSRARALPPDRCARSGQIGDGLGAERPVSAALPVLELPDRHGLLQRVDAKASRLEGLWPVRRRHDDDDRRLAEIERADAVEQDDATGGWPADADLCGDGREARDDLLVVGLIRELVHVVAHRALLIGAVVAHGAGEHHDPAAARPHCPLVGCADRQSERGEAEPVVALGRRTQLSNLGHETIVPAGAAATPYPGIASLQPVERSEWEDDDLTPMVPLLPADDRIWRHPSELGPYVAASARTAGGERGRGRFGLALVAGSAGALALAAALAVTTRDDQAPAGAQAIQPQSGMLTGQSLLSPITTLVRSLDRPNASATSASVRAATPTSATVLLVATTVGAAPATTAPVHVTVTAQSSPASVAWPAGSVVLVVEKAGQTRTVAAVVLGADGVLVTSAEAVVGATSLTVTAGGTSRTAEVLGVDHETGLVVLHAPGLAASTDLTAAAGLRRGSGVVIHVPATAWTAKVSELGASRVQQGSTVEHLALLKGDEDEVGTDSEPAVVTDDSGRVLGLCLMHDDRGRLMVPTELLEAAVRAVGATGEPISWLGVRGANVDTTNDTGGALVSYIERGSSADTGGLRAGDIITSFDGRPVASMWGLVLLVRSHPAGSTVMVTYRRGADRATATILLNPRPPDGPSTTDTAPPAAALRIAG